MTKFILFLLFLQLYLCEEAFNNWNLIFNEGEQITLSPGVFSRISIKLSNDEEQDYYWSENIEETVFKLSLEDDIFVFMEEQITLNSTESLVYSTFLGLKCSNTITEDVYELKIKVSSSVNDMSLDSVITLSIKINRILTPISLDTVINSMAEKSFNFFKLNNEIYNVDEIELETKVDLNSNGIDLKDLKINSFSDREILSEDNQANHAILFDNGFGLKKTRKELGKDSFNIKINFKDDKLSKCFSIPNSQFLLSIKKDYPENINNKIKTSIKYSIKDQTYNYDITNSIKIYTSIPIAPVMLTCEFKLNSLIADEFDTNKYNKIYKNFITKNGDIYIIANDLKENGEYYAFCELTNTNYEENGRNKINIAIGNFNGADKSLQLTPSKYLNRQPQCAKFYFENKIDLSIFTEAFKLQIINYCYYAMKRSESILVKGLPTILCQLTESSQDYITICVAPLALYNFGRFISLKDDDKDDFNDNFLQFITDAQNYYNNKFISMTKIKYAETINDIDISRSSINALFKNKTGSNPLKLIFEISSTHAQPVECYHNSNLNEYYKFGLFKKSIILQPNSKTILEMEIPSPLENKRYSLYFQCYNVLPHFNRRYKTTGFMTMYTYIHSNTDYAASKNQEKYEKTTINCFSKKNLLNPRCLIDRAVSIYNLIPDSIKEIETQIQKNKDIIGQAKKQLLQNLQIEIAKNFLPISSKNNNRKEYLISLFKKAIEFTKYLTNTDCSKFASGKSNKEEDTIKAENYIDCRIKKKNYLETIIDTLQINLDNLNCPTIIDTINKPLFFL